MYGPYRIIRNAPFDLRRFDIGTTLSLSKDGGATAASTNAPVETPAASGIFYNVLTATEMSADHVAYIGQAGDVRSDGFLIPEPCFDSGVAQSGSTTNIRLRAGAPSFSLVGSQIEIVRGTGKDSRPRFIAAYDTTTKDVTPRPDFGTAPDNTSVYIVKHLTDVNVFRIDGVEYAAQVMAELYNLGYITSTFNSGSTTTSLKTNMTGRGTDQLKSMAIVYLGAANSGIMRGITTYDTATGDIGIWPPLATAPVAGERFAVLGTVG